MPIYRIHRIKQIPGESFRWAPHSGGLAVVKAKDYEPSHEVAAANPYETWKLLSQQGQPLRPGDLLEICSDTPAQEPSLQIVKYIGFEPAQWFVPEPKPGAALPEQSQAAESKPDYESKIVN